MDLQGGRRIFAISWGARREAWIATQITPRVTTKAAHQRVRESDLLTSDDVFRQCVEENQEGGLLLVACDPDKEAQQWIYDSSQGEIREAKHAVISPWISP